MLQPFELQKTLPVKLANSVDSTTTAVWDVLTASYKGDLLRIHQLAAICPELLYAQYNYTPPIHFAVREGHVETVKYLLNEGALDPTYKSYPFGDSLLTIAEERKYDQIVQLLHEYLADTKRCKFRGDNGKIDYQQTVTELQFQSAVDELNFENTNALLRDHPEYVQDRSFFWGEGILMMPAKDGNRDMLELLMKHGASVPRMTKWGRFYYFKNYSIAEFLMNAEMHPQHHSWHNVTLLHDMAQENAVDKAALLLKHGADIDAVDEEYQSTPLGMASRWGHTHMAELLLKQGANPNKAGKDWAMPLAWAQRKGHSAVEYLLKKAGAVVKFP